MAAGQGTRLRELTGTSSKVLLKLLGMSLLERNIRALAASGRVEEVIVVTGYQGESIRAHLGDGSRLGLPIRYVSSQGWELGNGQSLYSARQALGGAEPFLLLMGDQVYQQELIERMAEAPGGALSLLAVAGRTAEAIDLRDATKVRLEGDRLIRDIGKELADFNGIDCGLFLLRQDIFRALEVSFVRGDHSLTGGVRELTKGGRIAAYAAEGSYWADIDTPADLWRARQRLLAELREAKDGPVAYHLNRRLSIPISRALANTPVTPNQVTLLATAIGVFSALLFGLGFFLPAGLLCQLSSVMDGVDGELARLKCLKSPWGGLLDSFTDRLVDALLILGMALGAYGVGGNPVFVLVFALLALMGSPLSMILKDRFALAFGRPYLSREYDGWASYLLANRDGRLFVIMLSGIFNQPVVGLLVLAVTTNLLALRRLWVIRRLSSKGQGNSVPARGSAVGQGSQLPRPKSA